MYRTGRAPPRSHIEGVLEGSYRVNFAARLRDRAMLPFLFPPPRDATRPRTRPRTLARDGAPSKSEPGPRRARSRESETDGRRECEMPRRVVPKEPSVRALPRRSGAGSGASSGAGSGVSSGVVKASRASTLALAKAAARAVLQASGFQSGAAAEAAGARDVIAAAAVAAQAFGPPDNDGSDDDSGNEPTHTDSDEDSDSAVDLASLDISGADTGTRARGSIEENGCVHREDRDTRDRSGDQVIRKPGT